MSKSNEELMDQINDAEHAWHDGLFRGAPDNLYVKNEIQNHDPNNQNLIVLNTRYFMDDGHPEITRGIQSYVCFETVKLKLEYDKKEKKYIVDDWEQLEDKHIEWDDLPIEVIENLGLKTYPSVFDTSIILEGLEEWYEDLDKVKFKDFPVILRPFIKKIIKENSN